MDNEVRKTQSYFRPSFTVFCDYGCSFIVRSIEQGIASFRVGWTISNVSCVLLDFYLMVSFPADCISFSEIAVDDSATFCRLVLVVISPREFFSSIKNNIDIYYLNKSIIIKRQFFFSLGGISMTVLSSVVVFGGHQTYPLQCFGVVVCGVSC